jgi:shikimate kinase
MIAPSERRRLMLSGFMGTGKSTVGRHLARMTGARFEDLDATIEGRAGRPIAAIFAEQGEAVFRELERRALAEALAEPEERSARRVIALGGGALVDADSRRLACQRAFVVTLLAKPATIVARCQGTARPLLASTDPSQAGVLGRVTRLIATRAEAYEAGHLHVRTDSETPEVIATRLANAWTGGHHRGVAPS